MVVFGDKLNIFYLHEQLSIIICFLIVCNSILQNIYCTSLNWSADGSTLFSGYTDGVIRVWGIGRY